MYKTTKIHKWKIEVHQNNKKTNDTVSKIDKDIHIKNMLMKGISHNYPLRSFKLKQKEVTMTLIID